MKAVGVAVVGAGYWGPNLIRNVQASPETTLQWVCDIDEDRARRVLGEGSPVKVTSRLEDVLNDPAVEAVAIATPARTHGEVAVPVLESGRHVLIEKPLAASFSEAEALVRLAESKGLVLMCDHTYCYTPAVIKIREIVQSGMLGDLQFYDSVRINLGLVQRDVDVLWDLAPHDLSILDHVLPEGCRPLAVAAQGADPIGAGRACIAYLTVQLSGGAIAHSHVNWLSPTKVRTTIIGGSKRTLVWDDLNPAQRISVFDRGVDMASPEEIDTDERRATAVSYRTGDMIAPALPEGEALRGVIGELAHAIREGRPALTDGRSGLRVLDVLEAASASLDYKGAVVPLRSAR
ncbi:Gfo/Idh/MocA family protein [Nocardioides mesophilus]|uniref:Gfo/Idh/MocA family oxidoreductase n=1 Tax=Nocardioides mesophilus TaxID=433659 RepID=A0A7G9R9A4_9ACTN|nr:Gfo/Idh/MocA family oxidoreductase [Nocardioides mesophilus]QNN52179.1 Gfo/Idh/MocA family oxidoreductase [Nocardioides mesophilus]